MSKRRSDIVHVVEADAEGAAYEAFPRDGDASDPATGRWFWVKRKDGAWLGCVTHLGSNYVMLEGPVGYTARVHVDNFESACVHEPDPEGVIREKIDGYQSEVRELMARVKELTARLSITTGHALASGGDTQALTVHQGGAIDGYKSDLVLAKDKTLPDLFKGIEQANRNLETWLGASLIPLRAQAEALKPAIKAIERRIFSVQLYAGLTEEVEKVKDGEPAAVGEKIRLFQRRHYMDEECLARYEVGGMEFDDLPAFDRWLVRPENLDRLLPFQRCIVAFQVRRRTKEREVASLRAFIVMLDKVEADKLTFLYIRNGEQVYRLSTSVDFGAQLFPDMDHRELEGKLYAKVYSSGGVDRVVPERQYLGMLEDEARQEREIEAKKAAAEKLPKDKRPSYFGYVSRASEGYAPYTHDNVYYDDISKHIQTIIDEHNKLVLVLQGLLDRSPVFQPHPSWSLWTSGGFEQALDLVFDDSRALTAGDKPDFEAYRARLNAELKPGCVTVGQQVAWEIVEGEKESERQARAGRDYSPYRYKPYGNPGPGDLAYVVQVRHRAGTCTYVWGRERSREAPYGAHAEVKCSFTTKVGDVLNVSAYKPGDFRKFFDDPRTRADYLEWAYIMLEAEEYHAGHREVAQPPEMPKRKKTVAGSIEYRNRKRRKALVGKAVRLTSTITTKGGKRYEKGSLWRVTSNKGQKFDIVGVGEDGQWEDGHRDVWGAERGVSGVHERDFEVDPTVGGEVARTEGEPEQVEAGGDEEPEADGEREVDPDEVDDADQDEAVDEDDEVVYE